MLQQSEKFLVARNAGHPWDGRDGFDLLFINTETQYELNKAIKAAEEKYWVRWLVGLNEKSNKPGGVMYKPCGIQEPWIDTPENPHPGNASTG